MADSVKDQMHQMFTLLSNQIANLQPGVPTPDAEKISDIEQHRRDNSHHDCTGNFYTDEDWDKWNAAAAAQREIDRERSPMGGVKGPLLPVVPKKRVED